MIVSDVTNRMIQRTIDDGGKVYAVSNNTKIEVISATDDLVTLKDDGSAFGVGDQIKFLYEPLYKSKFTINSDTDGDGIIDLFDIDADGDGVWDDRPPQRPYFLDLQIIVSPDAPSDVACDISPLEVSNVVAREYGKPVVVDRYYPLYLTEEEALAVSLCEVASAHSHVFNGITYWMPDCVDNFHGDYHTCIPDEPEIVEVEAVETYDFEYVDRAVALARFSSIIPRDYSQRVLAVDTNEDGAYDAQQNYSLIRRWNSGTEINILGEEVQGDPAHDHYQTTPEQAWLFTVVNVQLSESVLANNHSFKLGNYVYSILVNEKYALGSEDNIAHTKSILRYFSSLKNGSNAVFGADRTAYAVSETGGEAVDHKVLEVDWSNGWIVMDRPIFDIAQEIYITSSSNVSTPMQVEVSILTRGNAPSEVRAISADINAPTILLARELVSPDAPSEVKGGMIMAPTEVRLLFNPMTPDSVNVGILADAPDNVTGSHTLPDAPVINEDRTGILPDVPTFLHSFNKTGPSPTQDIIASKYYPLCSYELVTHVEAEDVYTEANNFIGEQGWYYTDIDPVTGVVRETRSIRTWQAPRRASSLGIATTGQFTADTGIGKTPPPEWQRKLYGNDSVQSTEIAVNPISTAHPIIDRAGRAFKLDGTSAFVVDMDAGSYNSTQDFMLLDNGHIQITLTLGQTQGGCLFYVQDNNHLIRADVVVTNGVTQIVFSVTDDQGVQSLTYDVPSATLGVRQSYGFTWNYSLPEDVYGDGSQLRDEAVEGYMKLWHGGRNVTGIIINQRDLPGVSQELGNVSSTGFSETIALLGRDASGNYLPVDIHCYTHHTARSGPPVAENNFSIDMRDKFDDVWGVHGRDTNNVGEATPWQNWWGPIGQDGNRMRSAGTAQEGMAAVQWYHHRYFINFSAGFIATPRDSYGLNLESYGIFDISQVPLSPSPAASYRVISDIEQGVHPYSTAFASPSECWMPHVDPPPCTCYSLEINGVRIDGELCPIFGVNPVTGESIVVGKGDSNMTIYYNHEFAENGDIISTTSKTILNSGGSASNQIATIENIVWTNDGVAPTGLNLSENWFSGANAEPADVWDAISQLDPYGQPVGPIIMTDRPCR